jgi:anti-anti-sigma factor
MIYEFSDKNGFRIVRIKDDITRETDLNELKNVVKDKIDKENITHLAVSFTRESNFYSPLIAVLVQFLGYVKEKDGSLAIIHPNEGMLDVIRMVGLGKLMNLYTSEDLIGAAS